MQDKGNLRKQQRCDSTLQLRKWRTSIIINYKKSIESKFKIQRKCFGSRIMDATVSKEKESNGHRHGDAAQTHYEVKWRFNIQRILW